MSNANKAGTCGSCGGRLVATTGRCPFCGAEQGAAPASSRSPLTQSVHDAVARWSRTVFAAPRRLEDHITRIEVRDEVIERVVTEIVRRDVHEERIPSNRGQTSAPRVHPASVDPYEVSLPELRSQSEYVAPCAHCHGAGVAACNRCASSGRMQCGNCNGSGKEVKYYKKSSRLINCKVCRASGTVPCAGCGGKGSVSCSLCAGGGNQLVWLTYGQVSRWHVALEPESIIVGAHPQLAERRYLAANDLDDFSVLAQAAEDGAIAFDGYRDSHRSIFRSLAATLDPRLERVNRQQYVKLAVVRRDATYQLAGAQAVLVLSGRELLVSPRQESASPIRRRLYLWAAGVAAVAIASTLTAAAFSGVSPYYARGDAAEIVLALATVAFSVPAIAAVTRELGRWALRTIEKVMLGGVAVAFVLLVIVGVAVQPRAREVAAALQAGDIARARVVANALKERLGPTEAAVDADDSVLIAESKALAFEQRLGTLDAVASHGKAHAQEATKLARAERLHEIRNKIGAAAPDKALAEIAAWFSKAIPADAEVAEEKARAHEALLASCVDSACKLGAANDAVSAASSAARIEAASSARKQLLDELGTRSVADEQPLATLKREGIALRTAKATLAIAAADTELTTAANEAVGWADTARGKVSLLGADAATVEELLGASMTTEATRSWIAVDDARVYPVFDAGKRCRGLYVVGATPGKRGLHGSVWSPDHLLSQAVGKKASVKRPTPETATSARWFETVAPVVARWKGTELVEVRIGDSAP